MHRDEYFADFGIDDCFIESITEKFLDFFSSRYIHQTDPGSHQISYTMKPRGLMGVDRIAYTRFNPQADMQNKNSDVYRDHGHCGTSQFAGSIDFIFFNGHIEKVPMPSFICSDEPKIAEYGERELWLDDWEQFFECMTDAARCCELSEALTELLKRLQKALNDEKEGIDSDTAFAEIQTALSNLLKEADRNSREIIEVILRQIKAYTCQYTENVVTGMFKASENSITIYAQNIMEICHERGFGFFQYLAGVLVHEFTHALHYYWLCISRREFSLQDYNRVCVVDLNSKPLQYWNYTGTDYSRTVMETIATCVEHRWFTCNSQPKLADNVAKKLENKHYPSYPYAGAKRYLATNVFGFNSDITMVVNLLLELSARSWKTAYNIIGKV